MGQTRILLHKWFPRHTSVGSTPANLGIGSVGEARRKADAAGPTLDTSNVDSSKRELNQTRGTAIAKNVRTSLMRQAHYRGNEDHGFQTV